MSEVDPNGIDAHAPGAKLDAGKLRPHLVLGGFANALEQVVKVGTDGAVKYSDNGWREVKDGQIRYLDAMGRHRLRMEAGVEYDRLSGSRHLAHLIWNALAVLELQSQPKAMPAVGKTVDGYDGRKIRVDFLLGKGGPVYADERPDFSACSVCLNFESEKCEACRVQDFLSPTNFIRNRP